jgi:uncharacterized protein
MKRLPPFVLLAALLAMPGCPAPEPAPELPALPFDTVPVRIETARDTIRISAELAATEAQRMLGLMERRSLPEDHGMLFAFDREQPGDAFFWMFRTRIPLDIAFLDAGGRILVIRAMEPCPSPQAAVCPRYAPGVPYHAALEVNRGFFAARGVGVGDRVVVDEATGVAP